MGLGWGVHAVAVWAEGPVCLAWHMPRWLLAADRCFLQRGANSHRLATRTRPLLGCSRSCLCVAVTACLLLLQLLIGCATVHAAHQQSKDEDEVEHHCAGPAGGPSDVSTRNGVQHLKKQADACVCDCGCCVIACVMAQCISTSRTQQDSAL